MELEFPIEFLVYGTPVSLQAKRPESREEWKERVKTASRTVLPDFYFASEDRIAVTLFYLPDEPMEGDIDNIIKLVLDAMSHHIYIDDTQVERLVVQKFEPGNVFDFERPSDKMLDALTGEKPVLYIKISNDPFEDLR
jgi:crossover junction endodeoxyribonuclease RusA